MGDQGEQSIRAEKVVARVGAFIAALVTIITAISTVVPLFTPELGQVFFSALNLIPLIIFYFSTKATRQEFIEDSKSKRKYLDLLGGKSNSDSFDPKKADWNLERVNRLVEQLHTNITRYVLFLIIVYVLYLFDNKLWFNEYLLGGRDFYKYIHLYFNIATGVFNYLSAVFLFLGFKVLYAKTLDLENNPLPSYHRKEAVFSGIFLTVYITLSLVIVTLSLKKPDPPPSTIISNINTTIKAYEEKSNIPAEVFVNNAGQIIETSKEKRKSDQSTVDEIKGALGSYEADVNNPASDTITDIKKEIEKYEDKVTGNPTEFKVVLLKLFQLFVGIFNGLAMALLFGRYVSMEQAIYNMEEGLYDSKKYNEIIHIATIYILPIYALAQPLFGSFDVNVFGNPKIFANGVFFVCWIGKMFFLYLTYLLMKRRLMHLYLHSVITIHGIPKELAKCFKSAF